MNLVAFHDSVDSFDCARQLPGCSLFAIKHERLEVKEEDKQNSSRSISTCVL
jgi:hypothetical protein